MGGLLAFHGIGGLRADEDLIRRELDQDNADLSQFLFRWHSWLGSSPVASSWLAVHNLDAGWYETFPTGVGGQVLQGARAIGNRLAEHKNKIHGSHVLRGLPGGDGAMQWWVEMVTG